MNDIEELEERIKVEKRARSTKFAEYLQEGLKKFNCSIVAIPQITQDGRISAVIKVVAND